MTKIIILRLSSAGDIIHGLPVAAALKYHLEDCQIGWLVEDRFADLLKSNPAIDKLFIVPRREWKTWSRWQRLTKIREIIKDIKKEGFTTSIDLQGLTKSSIASWLTRIPNRIGFDGHEGKELSPFFNNNKVNATKTHIVERNLELLNPLNLNEKKEFKITFPLPPLCSNKIKEFFKDNNLVDKKFIIINPGAGWKAKLWSIEKFAEVAKHLSITYSLPIVITWGGTSELQMAKDINTLTEEKCIIPPQTTLHELWEILAKSSFYLGCDTGPTHMAAATGVSTLALFGPTAAERNGPFGKGRCEVIQEKCKQYPLCWKKKYRSGCTCMLQITAKNVIQRAESIITEII